MNNFPTLKTLGIIGLSLLFTSFMFAAHPSAQETDAETQGVLQKMADLAEESIDFDQAKRERLERDGELARTYRQNIPVEKSIGNLYLMPSGQVVNAEDPLYHPTIIAQNGTEAFGVNWTEQNSGS